MYAHSLSYIKYEQGSERERASDFGWSHWFPDINGPGLELINGINQAYALKCGAANESGTASRWTERKMELLIGSG